MVDTGAEPSLIKISALKPDTRIDKRDILSIRGVTHERVTTLGSAYLTLYNTPLKVHVVPDSFPINVEGILGSTFLRGQATISYTENSVIWNDIAIPFFNKNQTEEVCVEARSVTCIPVKATGPIIGYVPRLTLAPGVTTLDCLVKQNNGISYIQCVNTSSEAVAFSIPSIQILEIDEIRNAPTSNAESRVNAIQSRTPLGRIDEILKGVGQFEILKKSFFFFHNFHKNGNVRSSMRREYCVLLNFF
ncbi:hypothetical protein WH47_06857 [Habropoda laboriosa]|uniref:Peptidase A2 domain-containing protein n=1 Tax=Habropoda laboriosa TaxID=597456 RepID=A0A0L7QIX6_9HYME|nr:hypothetical protein WH47_06857 [Habropoda laboriosa]